MRTERRLRAAGAAVGAVGVLAVAASAWSRAAAVAEVPEPLRVALSPPPTLTPGMASEVVATVTGANESIPLLVTPASEGGAVDVVRGRLLREDAEPEAPGRGAEERAPESGSGPAGGRLRFRIPILARAPGTAVLRVRAKTWRCSMRCRAIEADASLVLRVERTASGTAGAP